MENEVLKALVERRSCRKYKPQQIKPEELDAILKAGTYAPTGCGKQSPKIVVVQNPEVIAKISKWNADILGVKSDPFYGAPTLLIVLAKADAPTAELDGAAVITTLMVAAHSLGVASCWINRAKEEFATDEGKALLKQWGIEGDYIGVGHCILGYAAAPNGKPAPRKADYIVTVK